MRLVGRISALLRRAGVRSPRPGCGLHQGRRGRLRDEAGMTIMELLVGAGISLYVIGSVFAAVRVQGRSAAYQTGMADAQITSRGAGELILQDLRMAGFGMLGVSPTDAATYPPIAVDTSGGVTTVTLRGAFANVSTTLAGSASAGQTTLSVNPPLSGSFSTGNLVLVDSGLSSEVFTITSVGSNAGLVQIGLSGQLKNAYPLGPFVTQLEVVNYTYGAEGGKKVLRRNGQVVADNAPVFQLQYVADDGTVSSTPGDTVRSVTISFQAAEPSALPDNPTAKSNVTTEANMRNLAFRFSMS
jgi:Tfp pilus assembly protein PilW